MLAPERTGTEVPVDRAHVMAQRPDPAPGDDLAGWYLEHGLAARINPTPFFVTDWYAWQNPDWVSHSAPYLHYLEVGRAEGRDPSPFVDMRRYLAATGLTTRPDLAYGMILAGHRSSALGVYSDRVDLERSQAAFLEGIVCLAHRSRPPARRRRALVVLQCGRGSKVDGWFDDAARDWDLLVNYYDARGHRPALGDYVFFQKGTKFTAMWMLWARHRAILEGYEHVLFLDDDVETTCGALNRLFAECRTHGLDLAQMALTADSSCNWRELFAREGVTGPRSLSAVEIMMPVLSARALRWIAPTFGASVSGFGLDLAWGKIVRDAGGRIAVLDEVRATHSRPVDQNGGAYYSYLRRHGLNAKAELWSLVTRYGAARDVTGA